MIKKLVKALKSDPEFFNGWQANIAMAFFDEYNSSGEKDIHLIANKAAEKFLRNLINLPEEINLGCIKEINLDSVEGKYLLMAISRLSGLAHTDKTPSEILQLLSVQVKDVYGEGK